MPLSKHSLAIPSTPASVKKARSWVSEVLTEIDREDLVFGAQLGVSELVTNAILHAEPPLLLRVRGTREHPRVEVADNSPRPLRVFALPAADDEDVTTFGRGLMLVAMNSAHWGWDHDLDQSGKTVWFEPTAEMHEDFDLTDAFSSPSVTNPPKVTGPLKNSVVITLRSMPAQLFGYLRRYHFELRRELRLLSLSAPDEYPIAIRVTDAFQRADEERRMATGINRLDDAIAQGLESVDLEYTVPPTAPDTMRELLDLFSEVQDTFAEEELLAVTPVGELLDLQRWYFGEFVRQGRGEEPRPWTGEASSRRDSAS